MPEPDRPDQESIVLNALALPPRERDSYVDSACAGDAPLRENVLALLRGYHENSGFLEDPPASRESSRKEEAMDHAVGDRIGNYKLLERIGEGGSAVVYMAEQEKPIRRRVALKIIKLGMDTCEFVARFDAERQALALMDHPHIASVFDSGATAAGRPYFVMELVRGMPITEYCDAKRLTLPTRLRLFIQVCRAIQHAHQKGVIHRDLKPSNILVYDDGAEPVVKVIDFGIAKAIQGRLTEKTLFTRFHAFIGTPAYASPEQTDITNQDVDTRSDIYSLGVLLYELLAGHPPIDAATIGRLTFEEVRRMIREVEPPRPSQRVSSFGERERTCVAQRRSCDASRLTLLLRSDLDWIVMRCLEKDRNRRYETAGALAQDVQHFLAGEPVDARPPSVVYRVGKFASRHRLAMVAASGVVAAVLVGLITSSILLLRERASRERAELAEKAEAALRIDAELAKRREIQRSGRSAVSLSHQLWQSGQTADAIAYLVHAARRTPENTALATQLAHLLTSRNYLLPEHERFECHSRIIALRYSSDGRSLQVGTEDGTLRIFDAATGSLTRTVRLDRAVKRNGWVFPARNDYICGVRFVGETFGVLDVSSGRLRFPEVPLDPQVRPGEGNDAAMLDAETLRLSPEGRWVLAEGSSDYWIWDAATGALLVHQRVPKYQFSAFSPSGDHIAEISGDSLSIWALPTFQRVLGPISVPRKVAPPASYLVAHFTPDAEAVIVVDPWECFHQYNLATGDHRRIDHAGRNDWTRPGSVQVLPDGRLFTDGSITSRLWDLHTGSSRHLPFAGWAMLSNAATDATGDRILMTTRAGFARLVSSASGETVAEEVSLDASGDVNTALSPDGRQVAFGNARGTVRWLRVGLGPAIPLEFPALAAGLTGGEPARLRVIAAEETRLVDLRSGRDVRAPIRNPRPLTRAEFALWLAPAARFLVSANPLPTWEAWDFHDDTGLRVLRLDGSSDAHFFEFSADGNHDVSWSPERREIGIRDLRRGTFVGPVIGYPDGISGSWTIRLAPNGDRVAMGYDTGVIEIWDAQLGQRITRIHTESRASPCHLEFSPDGSRLAVTTVWGEARVLDASDGRPVSPPFQVARGGSLATLAGTRFSPDGRWLAIVGERDLRVVDAHSFALVCVLSPLSRAAVGSVEFSADGSRIGCGLAVWELPSGARILHATDEVNLPAGILNLQLTDDGRFLVYRVVTPRGPVARVRSIPPKLPPGEHIPEWLLRLGDVVAGRTVDDSEQAVTVPGAADIMPWIRQELARQPRDATFAAWGRWLLADGPERPIAPEFTVTPAEAERLRLDPAGASRR